MTSSRKKGARVTILQRVAPHYRKPFFQRLHERLAQQDIELRLIYGQEFPGTVPRTVEIEEVWATRIRNKYISLGPYQLVWQPCLSELSDTDLIIVEQANSMLINHFLQALRVARKRPLLAFWGHGSNRQAKTRSSISEWLKCRLIRHVDWWFAYTELSETTVRAAGFNAERLTVVNNSVETNSLKEALAAIDEQTLERKRTELGLVADAVPFLYCGGLYKHKRLDFLLKASAEIYKMNPRFRLFVIGDGPDRHLIEQTKAPWLKYLGEIFSDDRAVYFKMCKGVLMPGLVGLVIVDCFAAGLPIFTLEDSPHSPEISYLNPGTNGEMTVGSVAAYASKVSNYLADKTLQRDMRDSCLEMSNKITLEAMVDHFSAGIANCLQRSSTDTHETRGK